MHGRDIFSQILGIRHPWTVVDVATDAAKQEVTILVERIADAAFYCMACGKECPRYDSRRRRWAHLDTCQYKTIVVADVPRTLCPEHGVQQVPVPWAETNSRFTGLFEALAINWLREGSIQAVAQLMHLTWKEVDGVMLRAVIRGLGRRKLTAPERMGVDETSFQKRHEYVTVVTDLDGPKVLYVADDRKAESLAAFYRKSANMDEVMWGSTFKILRESSLQTSRAWAIKDLVMSLWGYAIRGWATKAWKKCIAWARRCHLEPMKKVASMVRDHLTGIINAIVFQATNAASESINSKIQKIKRMACGFCNRERFRNAIYIHLGGLDLYPSSAGFTRTNG
jgi:transposase